MPKIISSAPKGWRGRGWIPGTHRGTDFGFYNANPVESKRVVAVAPGIVVSVYNANGYNGGWGNHIIIDHGSGIYSTYSHFAPGTIAVSKGQQVSAGTYLGQMGSTGAADGDHQHTEIREGGSGPDRRVDPGPYFDGVKQIPDATPAAVVGQQRTVRPGVGTEGYLNGRLQANITAQVVQKLAGGVVGSFDGFVRGQQVTVNGVTSDIWFRGAFRGNYFAAAGFTSQSTDGLQDLGSVAIPTQTHRYVRITEPWFVFTSEAAARGAQKGHRGPTIPAGDYRIVSGNGPYAIEVPGVGVRYIGTGRTNPPVISK